MTGTQSLSKAQLDTIHREASRSYPLSETQDARVNAAGVDNPDVEPGSVVTIVIHQALTKADGRKRVQLHRAYADSVNFGLLRDGSIIPASQAA